MRRVLHTLRLVMRGVSLNQDGFTYIEAILYVSIVTIMLATLIPFAWSMIEGGAQSTYQQEASSVTRYISERIKYEIRNASGINSVTASSISLSETASLVNPTIISLAGGNVTVQQGTGSAVILNTADTTVSSLTFTNNSSASGNTKNISFVMSVSTNGSRSEYARSVSLQSSAEVRSN